MIRESRQFHWTGCIAVLFLPVAHGAPAQSDSSGIDRPLFASEATLAITIEGPISSVMREREEEEEFPATLRYVAPNGTSHELDIGLRARGKFRRKRDTCDFAPLRVDFKRKQVDGTVFAGQNAIKLVTDCKSRSKSYQQLVLKEYLAYKILNLLTDRSFRVRLLSVTYVDTDRDKDSRVSYAFFIEEKEHIAERLDMELVKIPRTNYDALDAAHSNLINVFEYFIGNTDFSLIAGPADSDCCHNAVIYQKGDGLYVPIPYDFDHAGLVDAPYAAPNPRFDIRSVKQRVYRGRCDNNEHLASTLQYFLDKRDAIVELVEQLDAFDERAKRTVLRYIDDFYDDTASEKSVERNFVKDCS